MLDKMKAEKKRWIPKTGYNVVGVDDFELPGEKLYLISHHGTEAEANRALAVFQKQNPEEAAYVYGPNTQ